MASNKEDLELFCQCTLLAFDLQAQYDCKILDKDLIVNSIPSQSGSSNPIGICMRYLLTKEFIRLQMDNSTGEHNFVATRLGSACLGNTTAVCRA